MRSCFHRGVGIGLLSAVWFMLPASAMQQDRLAEARQRYQSEKDPVRRAKALVRFGEQQFIAMRRQADAGDYEAAMRLLIEYRDTARDVHAALKATGRNADKKPDGFRQLQIHIRQSVHELGDTIRVVPQEQRPAFEAVRRELEDMDRELINALFPRQPGRRPDEKPAKDGRS